MEQKSRKMFLWLSDECKKISMYSSFLLYIIFYIVHIAYRQCVNEKWHEIIAPRFADLITYNLPNKLRHLDACRLYLYRL